MVAIDPRGVIVIGASAAFVGAAIWNVLRQPTPPPPPPPPVPPFEDPLVVLARERGLDALECFQLLQLSSFQNPFQNEAAQEYWFGERCRDESNFTRCQDAREGIRKLQALLANPASWGCDEACQESVRQQIATLEAFIVENCGGQFG